MNYPSGCNFILGTLSDADITWVLQGYKNEQCYHVLDKVADSSRLSDTETPTNLGDHGSLDAHLDINVTLRASWEFPRVPLEHMVCELNKEQLWPLLAW